MSLKISQMTQTSLLQANTDYLPLARSGDNYKIQALALVAQQAAIEAGSGDTIFLIPANLVFSQSATKAWMDYKGTAARSIQASYGLSSITFNGTGDYSVNFATSFSSASYGFALICGKNGTGAAAFLSSGPAQVTKTTSLFRFITFDNTVTLGDAERVGAGFWGDL